MNSKKKKKQAAVQNLVKDEQENPMLRNPQDYPKKHYELTPSNNNNKKNKSSGWIIREQRSRRKIKYNKDPKLFSKKEKTIIK